MIKFNTPKKLNGSQLIKELEQDGIITKTQFWPLVDGNGDLWLDIEEKDKAKAELIVNSHIGIDERIAKAEARQALLDKLGITQEEARLLLG